jgi:glycosyltransferase involved in cell wall biosynthesis
MKILFIHQNFPGQFKFLAPALVKQGHEVHAMIMQKIDAKTWNGVKLHPYYPNRGTTPNVHPWVSDFETKTIRAEAAFKNALGIKSGGFNPDLIIAHHGWGESLFLKEVWPQAKLAIYCEFYYHPDGADVGFDPEFPSNDLTEPCRLRLKNLNNLLHFDIADAGISPTHWQASTFPKLFQDKITVIHDGIDTETLAPNSGISLTINGNLKLTKQDEVITFVNRNLEPYRGYHIFMRSLPELLKRQPRAQVLIVGGDDVSYGARPKDGGKWKDFFINEIQEKMSADDWKRVHFLGNIPYTNFIALLQLSMVHVYLTYPFVLSWSLLEAMSVGCAIVASDTKPLHEAIKHNETGVLVDFFDTRSLTDQICDLIHNPPKRVKLGQSARKFAVANYDLESTCLPKQLSWVNSLK